MDTTKPVVKRDWPRFLGFDQATRQDEDRAGQPDQRHPAEARKGGLRRLLA